MPKKKFSITKRQILKLFSDTVSLLFLIGVLFSIAWFLYASYQYLFVPRFDPFSIKLDSFSFLEMKGREDCDLFHGFTGTEMPYPVVYKAYPDTNLSFSSFTKDMDFLFILRGTLTILIDDKNKGRQEIQLDGGA